MDLIIKESGRIIKCMEKEFLSGQMEKLLKVNGLKEIMLNKFNQFSESLKGLMGLTSLTIIIFFTFLILNIFFVSDKDAELKISEQLNFNNKQMTL